MRLQNNIERLADFVMGKTFWSVRGLHGLRDFALPSLGLTLRTVGYHSIFRLVSQGEYVVRCPHARRVLAWPTHER